MKYSLLVRRVRVENKKAKGELNVPNPTRIQWFGSEPDNPIRNSLVFLFIFRGNGPEFFIALKMEAIFVVPRLQSFCFNLQFNSRICTGIRGNPRFRVACSSSARSQSVLGCSLTR